MNYLPYVIEGVISACIALFTVYFTHKLRNRSEKQRAIDNIKAELYNNLKKIEQVQKKVDRAKTNITDAGVSPPIMFFPSPPTFSTAAWSIHKRVIFNKDSEIMRQVIEAYHSLEETNRNLQMLKEVSFLGTYNNREGWANMLDKVKRNISYLESTLKKAKKQL